MTGLVFRCVAQCGKVLIIAIDTSAIFVMILVKVAAHTIDGSAGLVKTRGSHFHAVLDQVFPDRCPS